MIVAKRKRRKRKKKGGLMRDFVAIVAIATAILVLIVGMQTKTSASHADQSTLTEVSNGR